MPTKDLDPRTGRYTVTFRLPAEAGAGEAWLAGDFNGWSTDALPMTRHDDGALVAVVAGLVGGQELRFRYYLGGGRWENDWAADAYVENEHAGHDSLLVLPDVSDPPPAKAPKPVRKAAAKKAAAKKAAPRKAAPRKAPD